MCTAMTFQTKYHYFGRTLDYTTSFGETVTITPRRYPFHFCCLPSLSDHYAIIGMAKIEADYPLYFDATNEKGLSIAGLNFPENAVYYPFRNGRKNIAPYELIPYLLGQYTSVSEVRLSLADSNLLNHPFSDQLPLTPLHWIIADRNETITVESTADGIQIYDNPLGILTNNPPFPIQQFSLNQYMSLSSEPPVNRFGGKYPLHAYSHGMGALGLPGDFSSNSRFVRAAFVKVNSVSGDSENESVQQFFHLLETVSVPRGCVQVCQTHEITQYTSCCNTDCGVYYYTTYGNSQITAVKLKQELFDGDTLVSYPLRKEHSIFSQN